MKHFFLIMLGLTVGLFADFSRDNTSEIVTDNITKLQWQDNIISETMRWKNAIDYCETLILSGKNDWRLPNFNELVSLVDDTKINPAIDTVFQNTANTHYWSSTTHPNYFSSAWSIWFGDGEQYGNSKRNFYHARCVRIGN